MTTPETGPVIGLAASFAGGAVERASTGEIAAVIDRSALGVILLASRKRWISRASLRHWTSVFETWRHPIDAITRRPAANRFLMAGVRGGGSASGDAAQGSFTVLSSTGTGTAAIWGTSSCRTRNPAVVDLRRLRG